MVTAGFLGKQDGISDSEEGLSSCLICPAVEIRREDDLEARVFEMRGDAVKNSVYLGNMSWLHVGQK